MADRLCVAPAHVDAQPGAGLPGPLGLIGAGRAGPPIAAALLATGLPVVAAHTRSAASRVRAAALLPGVPLLADPAEVARRAGLLLLAVPDAALPQLVRGLAGAGVLRRGQVVAHISGRYGARVLAPAAARGARVLALHPAMTFSGTGDDLARLVGSRWGVTGTAEVVDELGGPLVAALGGVLVAVAERARPAYHAALAHGANHLVTLVAQAGDTLRGAGIADAPGVLRPLLAAALDGALTSGDAATTGPVVRGDADTVAAHLRALPPAAHASYRALAGDTAARAVARGALSPGDAGTLRAVLAAPDPVPRQREPHPVLAAAAVETRTDHGPGGGVGPAVVRGRAELAAALEPLRASGTVALVPTMGALHEGHRALVRRARDLADAVVVSVFVNPLQFGEGEDLDRYPRTLDADVAAVAEEKADLVWAPGVADVYPDGAPRVRVDPGPAGVVLEGAARPGHFGGVLTVVAKLLGAVRPDVAVFGDKDAQQLALVRRMVRDLDLGVRVEGVPTVRAADGLALSSRNRYLSRADRAAAAAIPRALATGSLADARAVLATEPGLAVDYCELVDPQQLTAVPGPAGLLVIAAHAGSTRLIDNRLLES